MSLVYGSFLALYHNYYGTHNSLSPVFQVLPRSAGGKITKRGQCYQYAILIIHSHQPSIGIGLDLFDFISSHLCSNTEQSPQAVTEALRNTITVIDIVEETISSVSHSVEQICIVLCSETKRKDTGLSANLTQKRPAHILILL